MLIPESKRFAKDLLGAPCEFHRWSKGVDWESTEGDWLVQSSNFVFAGRINII